MPDVVQSITKHREMPAMICAISTKTIRIALASDREILATYANASWHSGGEFPMGLPAEAGGTHIGVFLAWAVSSGLAGEELLELKQAIGDLESRAITPGAFLFQACDGKLWGADLNAEGNAFAEDYYVSNAYYDDYESGLGANYPTLYHVPDSWDAFDRLKPTLDARLASWRTRSC